MLTNYSHENGYAAVLYGKSSMSIIKDGKEVLHTGSRTVNTLDEVKELLEKMPEHMEALGKMINSLDEDDEEGDI